MRLIATRPIGLLLDQIALQKRHGKSKISYFSPFQMSLQEKRLHWPLKWIALTLLPRGIFTMEPFSARNNGENWARVWRTDFGRFGLKDFQVMSQGNPESSFQELKLNPADTTQERLWKRVSLGKTPTGLNFNTIDSGVISLQEFVGHKITMAMVYENNNDLGNHMLSWAIERFELYGITDQLSYEERPIPFDPNAQDALGSTVLAP
jgi:hypothetical protein